MRGPRRGRAKRGGRRRSSHSRPGVRSGGGHLLAAFGVLTALTAIGTFGYVLLSGMRPFDALYMTVITLSTVGFEEIHPLGPAGRVFTLVLIVAGVGATFYAIGALSDFLIAGRMQDLLGRRAMRRTLDALRGHVVLCGFGRFGRAVAEELERSRMPFVVIDQDPALEALLEQAGHPYVLGSALEDAVLASAGVSRARALVAATGNEAANVFLALSAREANRQIAIHARAESDAGIRRLRLVGATQVVSPYSVGGQRVANAILRPTVLDFIELASPGGGAPIDLEEVVIEPGCDLVEIRLRDLPSRGLRVSVVAIKHADAPIELTPGADAVLRAGDRVVVVGDRPNLSRLAHLAECPGGADVPPDA